MEHQLNSTIVTYTNCTKGHYFEGQLDNIEKCTKQFKTYTSMEGFDIISRCSI